MLSSDLKQSANIESDFKQVEDAAFNFTAKLDAAERAFRKAAITIPELSKKQQLADDYWSLFDCVQSFEASHSRHDLDPFKVRLREIISPWLCRSKFFWRSYAKPHGYAGDFKIIDWMYDLETSAGEDPTEPALVNCLDYIFSTNHSVISLWDRRHWLNALLTKEAESNQALRVLDIACGGARYIQDFLDQTPKSDNISVTLVDQDPAALAFASTINLPHYKQNVETICAPIKNLSDVISEKYDVIISSGLFDYLDHETGSALIGFLSSRLNQHGTIAITNYHKSDRSAVSKDWCADWPLIFKDENDVARLFPEEGHLAMTLSPNDSLIMARWKK